MSLPKTDTDPIIQAAFDVLKSFDDDPHTRDEWDEADAVVAVVTPLITATALRNAADEIPWTADVPGWLRAKAIQAATDGGS